MRLFHLLAISAGLLSGAQAAEHGAVHWSYSGETAPEKWAALSPDFALCAGKNQSPVDLKGGYAVNTPDIAFNYQPSPLKILHNGHTVQVNYEPGSSVQVNGTPIEGVRAIEDHLGKLLAG